MLHTVVAAGKDSKAVHGIEGGFIPAFELAVSTFADSLPDRMLLCACLGAFSYCDVIMKEAKVRGTDDAIFTTLQQAMQVLICITVLCHGHNMCPPKPCCHASTPAAFVTHTSACWVNR